MSYKHQKTRRVLQHSCGKKLSCVKLLLPQLSVVCYRCLQCSCACATEMTKGLCCSIFNFVCATVGVPLAFLALCVLTRVRDICVKQTIDWLSSGVVYLVAHNAIVHAIAWPSFKIVWLPGQRRLSVSDNARHPIHRMSIRPRNRSPVNISRRLSFFKFITRFRNICHETSGTLIGYRTCVVGN